MATTVTVTRHNQPVSLDSVKVGDGFVWEARSYLRISKGGEGRYGVPSLNLTSFEVEWLYDTATVLPAVNVSIQLEVV